MNKKEMLVKNLEELQKIISVNSDGEHQQEMDELLKEQEKLIDGLDPRKNEDRILMLEILELNKTVMQEVSEMKKELVNRSTKMSDSRDNNKNYDLYK